MRRIDMAEITRAPTTYPPEALGGGRSRVGAGGPGPPPLGFPGCRRPPPRRPPSSCPSGALPSGRRWTRWSARVPRCASSTSAAAAGCSPCRSPASATTSPSSTPVPMRSPPCAAAPTPPASATGSAASRGTATCCTRCCPPRPTRAGSTSPPCHWVLEVVDDPAVTLSEIARAVRSGGGQVSLAATNRAGRARAGGVRTPGRGARAARGPRSRRAPRPPAADSPPPNCSPSSRGPGSVEYVARRLRRRGPARRELRRGDRRRPCPGTGAGRDLSLPRRRDRPARPGRPAVTASPTAADELPPDLVRPRYGEATLADVLPGAAAALGVTVDRGGLPADPLGLTGVLGGARRVAVLLIDSLGADLRAHAQLAPTLARPAPVRPATCPPRAPAPPRSASPRSAPARRPAATASSASSPPSPGSRPQRGRTGRSTTCSGATTRTPTPGRHAGRLRASRPTPASPSPRSARTRTPAPGSPVPSTAVRSTRGRQPRRPHRAGAGLASPPRRAPRLRLHPELDLTGHVRGVDSPAWRAQLQLIDRRGAARGRPPATTRRCW